MMKRAELETKKVAELKQMSRERGLKLESKGHKFTKSELIERLLQSEDEQEDINKKIEEAADDNEVWDEPVLKHEEKEEPAKEQKQEETKETGLFVLQKRLNSSKRNMENVKNRKSMTMS